MIICRCTINIYIVGIKIDFCILSFHSSLFVGIKSTLYSHLYMVAVLFSFLTNGFVGFTFTKKKFCQLEKLIFLTGHRSRELCR